MDESGVTERFAEWCGSVSGGRTVAEESRSAGRTGAPNQTEGIGALVVLAQVQAQHLIFLVDPEADDRIHDLEQEGLPTKAKTMVTNPADDDRRERADIARGRRDRHQSGHGAGGRPEDMVAA